MARSIRLLMLSAALGTLAACGGSGTGPSGNGIGTFTAVIDGVAWSSDNISLQVSSGGTVPGTQVITGSKLTGGQNYIALILTLGYISAPGTYPLGVNQGVVAGGSAILSSQTGSVLGIWNTGFSGSAGTVTITSLTSTRMAGTFQFTAPPQLGSQASGNRVVTNGTFDVPLGAGFVLPTAGNLGNRFGATIGGTAWNAATVAGVGQGGAFSLGGHGTTYNISLTTQVTVSAGNSYAIGGQNGFSATATNGSSSWGGLGNTGTVFISSLANGRAVGTFSGILAAGAGTSGALVITNGSFDVKILAP